MDIDLYINSVYAGFFPLETIEEHYIEYKENAEELAKDIDWDEVILYAIYAYDVATEGFISADFMCLQMPYKRYAELCGSISKNCRTFFVRGK